MAYAVQNKTDPVRFVLSTLIAETQSETTPDSILREFRATFAKRRSNRELLSLLESISYKRPNCSEVLGEINYILERKDPMYALLVFAKRIVGDDTLRHSRSDNSFNSTLDMPPPSSTRFLPTHVCRENIGYDQSSGSRSLQSQDLSTSTPVTSRISKLIDGTVHAPLSAPSSSHLVSQQASTTVSHSEQHLPRGDLSVIKKRVLHAVSNTPLLEAPSTTSSRTSNLSVISISSNGADIGSSNPSMECINLCTDSDTVSTGSGSGTEARPGTVAGPDTVAGPGTVAVAGPVTGTELVPANGRNGTGTVPKQQFGIIANIMSGNQSSKSPVCDGLPDEDRTHMLWNYYRVDGHKPLQKRNIVALPMDSQQRDLLYELIHVLTGMHGSYIVPVPQYGDGDNKEIRFAINMQLDKSLADIVHQILPLATYFTGVQRIIAATDGGGQVNNALNASLQSLTHDYYLLLTQVESEWDDHQLTVPKMLYYMQPTIWVMEEIYNTLKGLQPRENQGAAVLTHLCDRIKSLGGDKAAQNLIIDITSKAAAPYMLMLQLWIQKGVIVDHTQEFLVADNEVIHKDEMPEHYSDDYWEKRYVIRRDCIPSFLEKHADKILRTGKYLNVIRQCGKRVMPTQEMDLQFDPTNEQHETVINDAYYFSARMLLDVLLAENDLMGHLQSVKRYLLLQQGDFTMQFMDACEDELSKNVDQVLPMTLENLLGLTLRLSSARSDPYKDDLHCGLLTYDLVTQMSKIMNQTEEYWKTNDRLDLSGLECFAFTYEVKWPVSLVLNHTAITKYQMLFRQLFYCKHVERQLCKIWKENSIAKKFSPQAAELYRSAFTLRQRMMNAIQNMEYYMMIEIIEPNWHIFIEKMKSVENVDMVLKLHQDFLDLCLKSCMLTETSHVNRAIFKLCKICLKFCEFIQGESPLNATDTFAERVKRFDLEFTAVLISFLKQINDLAMDNTGDRFLNLVHRINFNGFYSDQIDKLCIKDAMG